VPLLLWVADITHVATAWISVVVAMGLLASFLVKQACIRVGCPSTGFARAFNESVYHSDHGSNFLSLVYTNRIVELGAKPSSGTVDDSFDNALAEAANGLYKTEFIGR
jgi:hypothetical protein